MKGQMRKIGLGGTQSTTATQGSCSTPTCASSLTLKPHSHVVQELIFSELTGLINVTTGTEFLATLNAE
jgi:hypothetical protein